MFHSGDNDRHDINSDLSVKQEGKNDILEPTCSGRKYTKLIGKKLEYFNYLFFLPTIFKRPNVPTARLKKKHALILERDFIFWE